ncbi:hypothetical protein FBZ85_1421 [Azospirillum brasilense]|nr:hypothetical protein FBZ85_1421 [Azospirillum brasilense]
MQNASGPRARRRPEDGLSRVATLIFAVAAGLSVANVYYAQPLLDAIARDFGISPAAIGLVVTLTQVGYALELIFIAPLGSSQNLFKIVR